MFRILDISIKCILGCGLALATLVSTASARTIYSFKAGSGDGLDPESGLIEDSARNLYGTTYEGGAHGGGTIFKLAPNGTETLLYSFGGSSDGAYPLSALITDAQGSFYGTTQEGGANRDLICGSGCGTIFKVAPDGTETVLYSFCSQQNCADGRWPEAGLVSDSAGNLYGTTFFGGLPDCYPGRGCGTVFKITPDGTESVLYAFQGASDGDGGYPAGALIADSADNLYGTASGYGANSGGVIFKVAPDGTETVLYNFCNQQNCADGSTPASALIADGAGNLYGTTMSGGAHQGDEHSPGGTVFKLTPGGTESVLYNFCSKTNCTDGEVPNGPLITDSAGNFYGTTIDGGTSAGIGIVFKLTPNGTESVLHAFTSKHGDGSLPVTGLIANKRGLLYGTTTGGGVNGPGYGTVFRFKE